MSTAKRVFSCCFLLPVLLVSSCCGKMYVDQWRYNLPGQVLASSVKPTQTLTSPMQVAEALDTYVQPRFAILRDKNFGAVRFVYRKHAGIVQLKVDTPEEKACIANVNAANRDYAISLLHCAPKPNKIAYPVTPELQLLYFNQKPLASDWDYDYSPTAVEVAAKNEYDTESVQKKAVAALPKLMAGKELRTSDASWETLMRPVRAFKQECLSCHTDAKPGATLGIMVYSVRKSRHDSVVRIGLR